MKKILTTLLLAIAAITVKAQVYVGGEAGFWRNYDANVTNFKLAPEVGYELNDEVSLGLSLAYTYNYVQSDLANTLDFTPYLRYKCLTFGAVNLFVDGGANLSICKISPDGFDSSHATAWKVGLRPGVEVKVAPQLSFISHMGFIGYSDYDKNYSALGEKGFGFSLKNSNLTFGLEYHF